MLDGLTPDLAPRLVLAIGGVGIALVILVLSLIFLKRRNSPLFIKGGKAREPRLMVLDAAAIDPKRRLVLIRRDEVEHLIMIGGPTDIVIETGITDRSKAVAPTRNVTVDDLVSARPAAADVRPAPPVAERRPEPVRPAAPVQAERPVAAPAEVRAAPAASQPVARATPQPSTASDKVVPASERLVERPQPPRQETDRQPESRGVSAMGPMLYGEDREPLSGNRPLPAAAAVQATPVQQLRPAPPAVPPVEKREQPAAAAAEAILDAARSRVLPNRPATAAGQPGAPDAEKALAARMEAMRRVQSAQPAVNAGSQPMVQPVVQRPEPQADAARAKDAEPSDFEKLLEAELDASGVFSTQSPQVRGDTRVTNATPAGGVVPPVRVSPPITGATPDVSSEEEVARLLGEIAINRRP